MAYCDRDDIEGIGRTFQIPDNFQTSDITAIIADVEDIIEDKTKNNFNDSVAKVLDVSGTGSSMMWLYPYVSLPIQSITSIVERDDLEDDWGDGTTLTSTDYFIPDSDPHRIEIAEYWSSVRRAVLSRGVWTLGQQNFRITASFGHSSVPVSIKKACVLLVRDILKPGYLKSRVVQHERWTDYEYETGKGISKNYGKSIPILTGYPEIDLLLKPYCVKVIDMGAV